MDLLMRRGLIAILAVAALVAACTPGPGAGGELQATDWVLRSYDSGGALAIVPETQYADANFASNRVRGFSGCNEYNARYVASGRSLRVSAAAVTLMACPEEAMAFEQAYLSLLDRSRFYGIRRDTLTIYDRSGTSLLVFDAAPRNPLRGTWRVNSFSTGPGSVSAVLPGTELEVVFGLASVGGFAGCNSFSGTYGTNGNAVRISRLATTRIACDQEVMDQEAAFLKALEGAALIETRANQVNLTDLSGSIQVALLRPTVAPEPSASASPAPTAPASAEPTAKPTPAPTVTPAPTPTPATPAPPTTAPTVAPSLAPPSPPPSVAFCNLVTTGGVTVAAIVYPGTWSTLAEPAELACRYFDPAPITVPADPATLETTVRASVDATAFADAVTAATDPAAWTVRQRADLTLDNLPATLVEAAATTDAAGIPVGTSRFAYLINVGSAGTITVWTTGAQADEAYAAGAAVVTLMTALSVFQSVP